MKTGKATPVPVHSKPLRTVAGRVVGKTEPCKGGVLFSLRVEWSSVASQVSKVETIKRGTIVRRKEKELFNKLDFKPFRTARYYERVVVSSTVEVQEEKL